MDLNTNERESVQVTIDNQPVDLPDWLSDTLPAIQTYLECMAMKKERVLWALEVDGIRVDLADCHEAVSSFHRIHAQTIGFAELSKHLISAGHDKIKDLLMQVEEASLLVLINDWSVSWRFWREWEPQLREPLFSLRALQELNLKKPARSAESGIVTKMLEELSFIVCEVEKMFMSAEEDPKSADPILFSELLEYTLLPWLKNLDVYFSKLTLKIRKR